MNKDLLAVMESFERDRGLEREAVSRVIAEAMESAAIKASGPNELQVSLDPQTGDITAVARARVVADVEDPQHEISHREALEHDPNASIGDTIEWEIPPSDLGRIVAQTTKQGIVQRLRQVEQEQISDSYANRIGELLSGVVTSFEKRSVILDFGGHQGVLPQRERVSSEDYQVGDHLACVLVRLNSDQAGPILEVSRADKRLIHELFAREVNEISEGVVEIKSIAREPGHRSKIAVHSNDSQVDPVGACVGIRGSRVKSIVRELNGEKIDIVRWSPEVTEFVRQALQPAEIKDMIIDEDAGQISILVETDQLSLAIGRRGQNARLTAKLTGWRIDIQKPEVEEETTLEEKLEEVVSGLTEALEIDTDTARLLADNGFLSLMGIQAADVADLAAIDGIDEETAEAIITKAGQQQE